MFGDTAQSKNICYNDRLQGSLETHLPSNPKLTNSIRAKMCLFIFLECSRREEYQVSLRRNRAKAMTKTQPIWPLLLNQGEDDLNITRSPSYRSRASNTTSNSERPVLHQIDVDGGLDIEIYSIDD